MTEQETTISSTRSVIIGSILLLLSQLCFGTNEALVKISGLPLSQILLSRFLIQLMLSIIWWNLRKNTKKPLYHKHWYGDKPNILNIWVRGFLYFMVLLFGYYGLLLMPIADELVIFYQSPLWIIVVAHLYLKEKLPPWYILIPSIILVMFGVIVLSQPTFLLTLISNNFEPLNVVGILFTCIAVFCWVACNILIRKAVKSHFLQLEMATSVQAVLIWIPLCLVIDRFFIHDKLFYVNGWLFDAHSIGCMICIGLFGFVAMALLVIGYQFGSATKVAWLEYSEIFVALLYQTFLFNDPPNIYESIGAAMVIIGCLLPVSNEVYKYCTYKNVIYHPVDIGSESEFNDNNLL